MYREQWQLNDFVKVQEDAYEEQRKIDGGPFERIPDNYPRFDINKILEELGYYCTSNEWKEIAFNLFDLIEKYGFTVLEHPLYDHQYVIVPPSKEKIETLREALGDLIDASGGFYDAVDDMPAEADECWPEEAEAFNEAYNKACEVYKETEK